MHYTPSETDYNAGIYPSDKHVQYFQNGLVVADTLFNSQHNVEQIISHNYQGNVYTRSYTHANVTNRIVEITHDAQDRITQIKTSWPNTYIGSTPIRIFAVTYIADTIHITEYDGETGQVFLPLVYTTDSNGY